MGLYNEAINQNIDNLQVNRRIGNGGGSGSGGYSKQTLYANDTAAAQSIVLSDSYKNYDALSFRITRIADSKDNYQDEKYFDKDYIEKCQLNGAYFQFFAYSEWNTFAVADENNFNLINHGGTVYVNEVIGIKY